MLRITFILLCMMVKNKWLLIQFGATDWVHAKAPAVLPTIVLLPSLQMWIQWKRQIKSRHFYDSSFDFWSSDPLKGFWGSHFENHVLGSLLILKWEFVSTCESSFFSSSGPSLSQKYNFLTIGINLSINLVSLTSWNWI